MENFGRPPHGGRGLKSVAVSNRNPVFCRRPPHGGRGLKWQAAAPPVKWPWSSSTRRTWIEMGRVRRHAAAGESSSTRRTWIEMRRRCAHLRLCECRPPHGGRGLKSALAEKPQPAPASSSTRRTWIEISYSSHLYDVRIVVLHTEDVD